MNNHGEKASPDAGRIAYLVHGFLQDKLTDAERDELDEWIEATPENMKLFEELTDGENLQAAQSWFQNQQQNEQRKRTRYQAIRRSIRRSVPSVVWYLAAACIVALLIGVYWLTKIKNEPVAPPIARGGVKVSPEPNQGILILSNGQKVPLDNVQTIRQQNFTVENGSIVYSRRPSTDTGYNTVVVPAGRQFKLQLTDGSTVWLNAGTTMRYPVAFGARNRAVELTGEGYFEVTHNPNRPFAVTSGEQTVLVLGTGFNVNAYPDEKPITTLVHGSVKISTPVVSKILKPREQSVISGNDINIATTDVKTATAWKEGLFVFKDETMRNISKQIARWYNVDVDYKNDIPYHFNATIERKEPLENFLQLLAKTNNVHFTLVNNRLTISP